MPAARSSSPTPCARCSRTSPCYGLVFDDGRYDIGNKLDYLRATVELALHREDLGPEFRDVLDDVVRREGVARAADRPRGAPGALRRSPEPADAAAVPTVAGRRGARSASRPRTVTSAEDVPPFANTAVDGYAVQVGRRGADAPVRAAGRRHARRRRRADDAGRPG